MQKKVFTILIAIFCSYTYVHSQNIDSLKNVVNVTKNDSVKIRTLYKLASIYTNNQDSSNAVNNYIKGIQLSINKKKYLLACFGNNQLGYLYELMNENKIAIDYYSTALLIAKKHNIYASSITAYSNMAFVYMNWGKLNVCIQYFDSCIAECKKGNSLIEEANALNNKGLTLQNLNKSEEALECYQSALTIYNKIGAEKKKSNTILNIGKIYCDKKNYDLAFQYFFEAKEVATKANNFSSLQIIENNIGVAFFNKKQYAQAIEHYKKSIELSTKTGNEKSKTEALTNIGSSYDMQGNAKLALEYYSKAELLLMQQNNYQGIITNYINQAALYGKQNQFNQAINFCDKAYFYITNYEGNDYYKQNIFEIKASSYKELGNLKQAFEYQDSQIMAKETFLNKQGNDKIIELQTRYETNEKEYKIKLLSKADSLKAFKINEQLFQLDRQNLSIANQKLSINAQQLSLNRQQLLLAEDSIEIFTKNELLTKKEIIEKQQQQRLQLLEKEKQIQELELNQKKNLTYGLGVLIALLSIGGYLFFRYKQAKQKTLLQQKLLEQEKQATINILAAEENERKRIATDLHDGVGQILTATWLNLQQINEEAQNKNLSNKDFIQRTLNLMDEGCKEVRAVSHNMMPNALLKKGLIDAVREFIQQIHVKQTQINLQTQGLQKLLPNHIEAVLYRVIQESVNNVIKHAQATRLDISITQDEMGDIDVLIEDNGKGFNVQEALKKEGIGIKNIQSRIEYLKGTIEWDTSINSGTVVAIHIPSKNEQ